ncbi:hypothetical protein VP01_767g3 [Puccinia sorghi]|uniref:Uncharacterized protein n=1 Tax=Puccinia sorghi TaxID=27349 RepID=A0A0L6UCK5_9BASI|nr:hypothetical protein VP01_767g3 [Puccinia sorghi]
MSTQTILNSMDGEWHKSCIAPNPLLRSLRSVFLLQLHVGQTNADDCHPQQKINTQGSEFHSQHLPPNYAYNPKITSRLDSLIASIVKAEKTKLASLIQGRLTNGEAAEPVPYLAKLVTSVYTTMDPCFKDRSEPEVNSDLSITKGAKTPTVWELVNQDLHNCHCNQAQTAKFAFAELIIERNHQLWDGGMASRHLKRINSYQLQQRWLLESQSTTKHPDRATVPPSLV